MKKVITIFSVFLMFTIYPCAFSHQKVTPALSPLIKMYKTGNYTECYTKLVSLSKKDPSNAMIYYYLGMTATQLGKKEIAMENYNKAVSLAEPSSNLQRYAKRGIACIESSPACTGEEEVELSPEELFIKSPYSTFSEEARGEHEKLKLENMMREINRTNHIDPSEFKNFKDFSGMKQPVPTDNNETLAILRAYNAEMDSVSSLTNDDKSYDLTDLPVITPEYMQMLLMKSY